MVTPQCERAIEDAVRFGAALMRSITPNNVGLTGGHETGYYLPKDDRVWPLFTPQPPEKGVNHTHPIEILWQNGRVTQSTVKWYGLAKSEYRITRFGKDFPYISHLVVGDLLVLVPEESQKRFRGYVLDQEEDINEITTQLGANPARQWSLYQRGVDPVETEEDCIENRFRQFVAGLTDFPQVEQFSGSALAILADCQKRFSDLPPDEAILKSVDTEFELFRRVERQVYGPVLVRVFKDIDDFIATAQTILQRRKSRAGLSLENHVEHYLRAAEIPHEMQPDIDGQPDCVIPSAEAYHDSEYPDDRLFILGVKRTCRDRWRQVLNEGKRVREKHIFTLERGISGNQLSEMRAASLSLVVPESFHMLYPPTERADLVMSVEGFFEKVKARLV